MEHSQEVVRGSTRNQAGILEVTTNFLTTHRQKSTAFYNLIFAVLSYFSLLFPEKILGDYYKEHYPRGRRGRTRNAIGRL